MWLLVGLGNPGPRYARNRHSIGFMVIDEIARRHRIEGFRSKFGGEVATGEAAGEKVVLLKPMEYMNLSGRAVQRVAAFHQVPPDRTVVVHDEIDLALGRLKLKVGGGHGGHNGLRSIIQDTGAADFVRVRCGVGRPGARMDVADYVLADFQRDEQVEAEILVREAADAIELIVSKGTTAAMNRFNVRDKEREKAEKADG